jgi:ubiquinone/menaquinone biosynthesis C-methylase UbiE
METARTPNAQYNLAAPDSLAVRLSARVRGQMFDTFMAEFAPSPEETVLDIGATSDQTYSHSNYFEALYPHKQRITAAGIDDCKFLEQAYPGVKFERADALDLPFADRSFDLVHSAAVLEHVGSRECQARMIAECFRVARRGVCLTTPNRWFPVEFHTQIPLLHWLPNPVYRAIYRAIGFEFFAEEANLNLLTRRDILALARRHPNWCSAIRFGWLAGLPSNLILCAHRTDS